jgi:hypothetical protein
MVKTKQKRRARNVTCGIKEEWKRKWESQRAQDNWEDLNIG